MVKLLSKDALTTTRTYSLKNLQTGILTFQQLIPDHIQHHNLTPHNFSISKSLRDHVREARQQYHADRQKKAS